MDEIYDLARQPQPSATPTYISPEALRAQLDSAADLLGISEPLATLRGVAEETRVYMTGERSYLVATPFSPTSIRVAHFLPNGQEPASLIYGRALIYASLQAAENLAREER